MANQLSISRLHAFKSQQNRCFYCGVPMWLKTPDELPADRGLTKRQFAQVKCTAEHLLARQSGGKHERSNIVAACRYCNWSRHARKSAMPPDQFKRYVSARVQRAPVEHVVGAESAPTSTPRRLTSSKALQSPSLRIPPVAVDKKKRPLRVRVDSTRQKQTLWIKVKQILCNLMSNTIQQISKSANHL